MTEKAGKLKTDRRDFLKFAGLGAVAGGAALATGDAQAAGPGNKPEHAGYSETEHVKTFYELAKF